MSENHPKHPADAFLHIFFSPNMKSRNPDSQIDPVGQIKPTQTKQTPIHSDRAHETPSIRKIDHKYGEISWDALVKQ